MQVDYKSTINRMLPKT